MQKLFATALLTAACQAVTLRTSQRDNHKSTMLVETDVGSATVLTSNRTYGGGALPMIESTKRSANYDHFMAEVSQYTLTCSDTFDRFSQNPDVAAVLAADAPFVDASFPQAEAMYHKTDAHDWVRMSDAFPASDGYSLFENNLQSSINIGDTLQGFLGDCWLLSSIAAMAEHPQRIWDLFETREYNSEGIYSLKMWDMGVPISIVIDDFLPINESQNVYAKANHQKETWPLLVEKAFAKLMGNYWSIEGGAMLHAGMALAGTYGDEVKVADMTVDEIWAWARQNDSADHIMTASIEVDRRETHGLVGNHAYTFIHTFELSNGARVFKLRNPWGHTEWKGYLNDADPYWAANPADAALVGERNHDDGTFIITVEDFKTYGYVLNYNYDPQGWHHAYWMALGDGDQVGGAGTTSYCGATCKRTTFDIYSEVAQTVHVATNFHMNRQYIESPCQDNYRGDFYNYAKLSASSYSKSYIWHQEPLHWTPVQIAAGETFTVTTELDWNRPNLAKDFSVTAWGELGPLTITEQSGKPSAHYNLQGPQGAGNTDPATGSTTGSTTDGSGSTTDGSGSTTDGSGSTTDGSGSTTDGSTTDGSTTDGSTTDGSTTDPITDPITDPTPDPAPQPEVCTLQIGNTATTMHIDNQCSLDVRVGIKQQNSEWDKTNMVAEQGAICTASGRKNRVCEFVLSPHEAIQGDFQSNWRQSYTVDYYELI